MLEALSCELPCIATKVGGILDVIEHGKNGILVDAGDEDGSYEAVVEMLGNKKLAKSLGKEGRRTVLHRFSIASVSSQHMNVFSDLLKRRGAT